MNFSTFSIVCAVIAMVLSFVIGLVVLHFWGSVAQIVVQMLFLLLALFVSGIIARRWA